MFYSTKITNFLSDLFKKKFFFLCFLSVLIFLINCESLTESPDTSEEEEKVYPSLNEDVIFLAGDSLGFGINVDYINTNGTTDLKAVIEEEFDITIPAAGVSALTEEDINKIDLRRLFNLHNLLKINTSTSYTNVGGYVEDIEATTSYKFVNFSIPGFTTQNIYYIIKKLFPKFRKNHGLIEEKLGVDSVVPGSIVIHAGGNDLIAAAASANITGLLTLGIAIKNNLKLMIEDARKIHPDIDFYLVNNYDILDGDSATLATEHPELAAKLTQIYLSNLGTFQSSVLSGFSGTINTINDAYAELASDDDKIHLVDVHTLFLGKGFTATENDAYLIAPHIHPNTAGYQVISEKLKDVISATKD